MSALATNVVPFPAPTPDAYFRDLLTCEITVALGRKKNDTAVYNETISLSQLLTGPLKFREGEKDGFYLLQGECRGTRASENMVAQDLMIFDVESGDTEEHAEERLRSSGLFGFIYPTHSNGKEQTEISDDTLHRLSKKSEHEGKSLDELARIYLSAEKRWRPWLVESIRAVARVGATYIATHDPMPRFRCGLVLEEPFKFEVAGQTVKQRIAEWKAHYAAIAARLDLVVDLACADPARLFYLPRHARGTPSPRSRLVKGETLELPAVPAELPECTTTTGGRVDLPALWEPETNGLKRWAIKHPDFDAVGFWEAEHEPRRKHTDGKCEFPCPFEDAHTGAHDGDRAFVVWNANERTGWDAFCQHQGCQWGPGKCDRLQFLNAECQARGIKDASELLKWCSGGGEQNDLVVTCAVPPGSETDLSCYIAEKYSGKLRYVAKWGQWLMFDGQLWRKDDTLAMWEMVKREVADYATRTFADKPAVQRKLASKASIAAVEYLTRADRSVAATVDQWDRDPMLLNTPRGVVDLRTGSTRPAEGSDYLTKITAVAPGGDCPQWLKFLDQITAGDRELQAYLQRVFGYALTGSTKEHAMFFGYGTGGNGKGVLLNTLIGILHDYALHAPVEVFTATKFDRHTTELARLQGARLVVSTETEKGRQWAEARIKAITGGDPITARYMRQDDFTYTPQFKLFITGNHMPSLSHIDEAMRRRLNMIPFTVTIPAAERDPDLAESLRSEWGGILAWGIQGCVDWYTGGLRAPKAVLEATKSYFSEQDPFERWLKVWCDLENPTSWAGTVALFENYERYCQLNNYVPVDQKAFVRKLEDCGLTRREQRAPSRQMGFLGIKLLEI